MCITIIPAALKEIILRKKTSDLAQEGNLCAIIVQDFNLNQDRCKIK
jgi:hypothetical protein